MLTLERNQMLSAAIAMAANFHGDQLDRGGKPYILHPVRVMLTGRTLEEQIVGVLHDTIEDTPARPEWIEDQFGPEIRAAVCSVSRGFYSSAAGTVLEFKHHDLPWGPLAMQEPYKQYIRRAKLNPIGRAVKINDLMDNLRDERMRDLPDDARCGLQRRYLAALNYLENRNLDY